MNILGVHYGQSHNLLIFEIGMLLCCNVIYPNKVSSYSYYYCYNHYHHNHYY